MNQDIYCWPSGPVENIESVVFEGNLSITNASYSSSLIPEPVEEFSADAFFDNHLVKVNTLSANFPSGQLGFSGRIYDLVPYLLADSSQTPTAPSIEGKLTGDFDLAAANQFLPPKGNPELQGKLLMDLQFTGSMGDLRGFQPRGTIEGGD